MEETGFRDPDRSKLDTFAQHVSIAHGMADEYEALIARAPRETEAGDAALDDFKRQVSFAWEGGWDQMQQARAIVAAMGRVVAAFDTARASAGDLYLGVVEFRVTGIRHIAGPGHRSARQLAWQFRSPAPLRAAVAAMRAAVPEVVIPEPPRDAPVADLSPKSKAPWVVALLAFAGAAYYFLH